MILSEVIQSQANWDSIGIHCTDAVQFKRFHTFLREAVLDRHIPHHKIIGVSYMRGNKSLKRMRSFVNIEGNDSVGESFPELMRNLQDKIVLFDGVPTKELMECTCTVTTGPNKLPDTVFKQKDTDITIEVLYLNDNMCVVMDDVVILQVFAYYNLGYMDMARTSHVLSKSVFPFYVDYSLQDYVRVLPPPPGDTSNIVRVRFYHGMTKEKFISILSKWEQSMANIDFGTEEKLWLQHSEH